MCKKHGIDTRGVGAHAPWQHGFAERHGGILGTIFGKMVAQFGVESRDSVKTVLSVFGQAKISFLMKTGLTPRQAVFWEDASLARCG